MKRHLTLAVSALALSASAAWSETIAVITPYLAQPGTQAYVEGFEAAAAENEVGNAWNELLESFANVRMDFIRLVTEMEALGQRAARTSGPRHRRLQHRRRGSSGRLRLESTERFHSTRRRPR